jgi:hypothetical protein
MYSTRVFLISSFIILLGAVSSYSEDFGKGRGFYTLVRGDFWGGVEEGWLG